MNKLVAVAALALAGVCFWIAFLVPNPARAQECFLPWPVFLEMLKGMGGTIITTARYPGTYTDLSVVYTTDGKVLLMGFQNGCAVREPLILDTLPKPPPGTPA